jgi:hypothetical protein
MIIDKNYIFGLVVLIGLLLLNNCYSINNLRKYIYLMITILLTIIVGLIIIMPNNNQKNKS